MSKTEKIMIGLPVYDSVPAQTFKSYTGFLLYAKSKYKIMPLVVDSTTLCMARNIIATNFLKTDAEYLLFLDSDMIYPKETIDNLIKHDEDFVSALYYSRTYPAPCLKIIKDGIYRNIKEFQKGVLLPVDAVGLGTALIKRNVIEKVSENVGDNPMFKNDYSSKLDLIGEDV